MVDETRKAKRERLAWELFKEAIINPEGGSAYWFKHVDRENLMSCFRMVDSFQAVADTVDSDD